MRSFIKAIDRLLFCEEYAPPTTAICTQCFNSYFEGTLPNGDFMETRICTKGANRIRNFTNGKIHYENISLCEDKNRDGECADFNYNQNWNGCPMT